jgi:hypothetical protein
LRCGIICAAASAPLEPGGLLILHVTARSHSKQRLELGVEDVYLDVRIVQPVISADGFLVRRFSPGAVETGSHRGLPCEWQQQEGKAESFPDHWIILMEPDDWKTAPAARGSKPEGSNLKQG